MSTASRRSVISIVFCAASFPAVIAAIEPDVLGSKHQPKKAPHANPLPMDMSNRHPLDTSAAAPTGLPLYSIIVLVLLSMLTARRLNFTATTLGQAARVVTESCENHLGLTTLDNTRSHTSPSTRTSSDSAHDNTEDESFDEGTLADS